MTNPLVRSIFPMNPAVFEEEVAALGMSVNMEYFNGDEDAGDFEFYFDGDPTAGDESAFDGVIAAHDPADFSEPPFRFTDEDGNDTGDDSGDEINIGQISNIMPEPGPYFLAAGAEVATTTTNGTNIARWKLYVTKNGNEVERQSGFNDQHLYQPLVSPFQFDVKAGDVYSFRMTVERQGPAGNAARWRRVRIRVRKDN